MGVPLKLVKRRGVRGGPSNNRDRSRFWPCLVFVVVTINTKISYQSVDGCMLRSSNFCKVALYPNYVSSGGEVLEKKNPGLDINSMTCLGTLFGALEAIEVVRYRHLRSWLELAYPYFPWLSVQCTPERVHQPTHVF